MDEQNSNLLRDLLQNFKVEVQPILLLLMLTLKGLNEYQEELVGGRQKFNIRTGKGNIPEEVQQRTKI